MPVRKTAAKKTATPAKKTATTKKVAAKKTAPPKSASASADESKEAAIAAKIVAAIKEGNFDPYLNDLDSALTDRMNRHITEKNAAAKKSASAAPAEKKVSAPPKKKKTVTITPEPDGEYKVSDRLASLAGAKVKFIRFKADSDSKKSVVEMLTGKPGSPKGKRVVIPTSALEESGDAKKKRAVKKK